MKFYGTGTVWDKGRDTVLAKFNEKGEFKTDNARTQGLLKDGGYLGDYDAKDFELNTPETGQDEETVIPETGQDPDTEPNTTSDDEPNVFDGMSLKQLKEHAEAAGIKYAINIGKAKLVDRLKGAAK